MAEESDFTKILVDDVAAALARYEASQTQSSMRDVVRAAFAAIEGTVWIFREHVVDAATATYGLEPEEKAILEEETFQVNAQGKITRQARFLPLHNSIRFVARVAKRLVSREVVDFSQSGWQKLQDATLIRNRITHPKSASDLTLSQSDVETVLDAMYWWLAQAAGAMEGMNAARKKYLGEFRDVLELLNAGDRETLALYDEVTRKLDEG